MNDTFLFGAHAISYLSFLSEFLKRPQEGGQTLSAYFKSALYTIQYLAKEESFSLHSLAVQEILSEAGGSALEEEPLARDLLLKELLKECKEFSSFLETKPLPELPEDEEFIFSADSRLCLDEYFSRSLAKIGPHGKALAEELFIASKSWHESYQADGNRLVLFRLWVDPDRSPYYCRYLKLLAETLWKDRIEAQYNKNKKQLPAITQSVQRPLSRFLSPRAELINREGCPAVLYEGKIVAEVAAIDPKLLPLVTKGTQSLSSIYHHKLLRYECRIGFDNWAQAKSDPRVMRYDGGETEIAEILGFKFKEAPSIIKSLLHAQAHMNFCFDDGSRGNLIELREYRSRTTNREDGIEIVLGTQLMPCYTFQTDRRGRLLVPVPELPPFVSAPQYHAGQALLQMLLMEEFTNKSLDLAAHGSIEITEERWEDFLKQSGLPLSVFKQVRARWLIDGDDGAAFLQELEENHFTIGPQWTKELTFFRSQGVLRKERQRQGRISVKKRNQKTIHTKSRRAVS